MNYFENTFTVFQEYKRYVKLFMKPCVISIENLLRNTDRNFQNNSAPKSNYKDVISFSTSQDFSSSWKFLPSSDIPSLHNLPLRHFCKLWINTSLRDILNYEYGRNEVSSKIH